jgi:hypothetical protein
MLKKYDSNLMNAYPISPEINHSLENDKKLIKPIGNKVILEVNYFTLPKPERHGYYYSQKRRSSNEPVSTLAERMVQSKL